MKNTLILFSLLFCTSLFAQEEWGNVVRNELTMKEIAPVWPGCETGDVDQRSDCFTKKLTQHVIKNFKYPPEEYKKNIQGEVVVEFYITEDGLVDVVTALFRERQKCFLLHDLAVHDRREGETIWCL